MTGFVVLLRGVNVGGKNKIAMAELRRSLEALGCEDVRTYIQSGNALLRSPLGARQLGPRIERMLSERFALDSSLIRALVLTHRQLQTIVTGKPEGFGERPDTFHSDVIFLIGVDAARAMSALDPREGVDRVWPGDGVIYSQRLSALRTRSRLGKIASSPHYPSMTIRSWSTVTKLLALGQRDPER
jgi:uncharacterized protein (DUF1697 family)